MHGDGLELEPRVVEVLARWDRRLETAVAAWDDLGEDERRRREADLDAAGETDEWVVVLWNWWQHAAGEEQEELRSDVAVLSAALWPAPAGGHLDGPSEEAAAARHLLRALDRMVQILGVA